MKFLDAFAEGWTRGTFAGLLALFVGLVVAEVARYAGLPKWMTVGLGVWGFLVVVAILFPPRKRA